MTYLVLYNNSQKNAISAAASKDFLRRIAAVSKTSRHFALRPDNTMGQRCGERQELTMEGGKNRWKIYKNIRFHYMYIYIYIHVYIYIYIHIYSICLTMKKMWEYFGFDMI